jgi:photosystem II stability/assembly factor-like uncharacterized protein
LSVWTDFRNGEFGSFAGYFPDFAMLVSRTADTLAVTDSMDVVIKVPDVKLYTHSVKFSATVSPDTNFTFSFPQGHSLTSYPDSLMMKINWNNVPQGTYEVTVEGKGPNGTPVHRRTISILATAPFTSVQQPNGGEELFVGTTYRILWLEGLVDTVRIDCSTDGGTSWVLITPGTPARSTGAIHPKLLVKPMEGDATSTNPRGFNWLIPNTVSSDCLVRVSDKADSTVFDISDTTFAMIPAPAAQWRTQTSGNTSPFYSVSVIDTTLAWAAGGGGNVYRTLNGGTTWSQVFGSAGDDVYNIFGASISRAFVATNAPSDARIRRTINGGLTWQTVYQDTNPSAFINAVKMFDDLNGYAMGDPVDGRWTLLRTTDGGITWAATDSLLQSGNEAGWNNSMWWLGNQYGWFGTDNNQVYRTTDSGAAWTSAPTTFLNSFTVSFATHLLGIAGGTGTAQSTDGGATWSDTPNQPPGTVFGGAALDLSPSRWYLIAGTGIYKTADHGATFQLDFSQANPYQHIDMKIVEVGGNPWICGYAVGDQGTITKYLELVTTTGIQTTNAPIQEAFSLSQNYPNPFNPTTTIFYSLPKQSTVSLKIVNVIGQEVKTLVNDVQTSGFYEAAWDGRNSAGTSVASGLYFYRLEARAPNGRLFSDIKKMLLLK